VQYVCSKLDHGCDQAVPPFPFPDPERWRLARHDERILLRWFMALFAEMYIRIP
jgi:hypothetical protein